MRIAAVAMSKIRTARKMDHAPAAARAQ